MYIYLTLFHLFKWALRLVFIAWKILGAIFLLVSHLHDVATECLYLRSRKSLKRVVIVGGGFAGARVAKALQHNFRVTLIDNKGYFEYTPSILRSVVEPWNTHQIRISHQDYLSTAKVHVEEVREVRTKPNQVITNNKIFEYDYLVLCTGSSFRMPFAGHNVFACATTATLGNSAQELQKARSVLIIGGGTVGVELAGEILDVYPDIEITIAQSSPLLHRYPKEAGRYATDVLTKRGVTIIKERIKSQTAVRTFQTVGGMEIQADIAFCCIGTKPNSQYLRSAFSDRLKSDGFAIVNAHLQFEEEENVFVAGDLLATDEEKLAQASENSAYVVAYNIRALEKGHNLQRYDHTRKLPMVISVGKYDGIFLCQGLPFGIFEGWVMKGFLPALCKEVVEWKWRFSYA